MKKIEKTIIVRILLLSLIVSVCSIGITQNEPSPQGETDKSALKTSGYTVTQKWSWKNTTVSGIYDAKVEISLDGNYIIARWDSTPNVTLFKQDSNATVWMYENTANIRDIAISGDGKYIVVCNNTHVICLNNSIETPKTELWTFDVGTGCEVDISLTGDYICAINDTSNQSVFLLNSSGQVEWIHNVGTNIHDIAISGDGRHVIIGEDNGYVFLFNTTDYMQGIPMWSDDMGGLIDMVAISDDGNYALAVDDPNTIHFFNTTDYEQGVPMWTYTTSAFIEDLGISSNGHRIQVTDRDYMNYFNSSFSEVSKIPMWSFPASDDLYYGDINADGTYCVGGTFSGGSIYLLNNSITNPKSAEWSGLWDLSDVAISGWGDYFIAADKSGTLYLIHHDRQIPDIGNGGGHPISYSNYYLFFAVIGAVSLIIIQKRKVKLSKK